MEQHIIDLIEWMSTENLTNVDWGIVRDNEMPLHVRLGVEQCDYECRNFMWVRRLKEDLPNMPDWALCLRDRYHTEHAYFLYPFTTHNN